MTDGDGHDGEGPDGDTADRESTGREGDGKEVEPELEAIDERIRRVETIVRALEAGEVAPGDRAGHIAEGKALVETLERDLEAAEEEATEEDTVE